MGNRDGFEKNPVRKIIGMDVPLRVFPLRRGSTAISVL
jgi:hypothetical protein